MPVSNAISVQFDMRAYIAEVLGTFFLVFAGTGAIVFNDISGGVIGHVGIAFTFGLTVLSVIYAIGDTSGAHINPAVTLAFWIANRFPGTQVLPYIVAQCLGACLASGVLALLFVDNGTLGATQPTVASGPAFLLEVILTWWLMFVILGVSEGAKEKGIVAGIVIGAVVALEAMFAGPVSGASMNPARSLGPALWSGQLQTLWLYVFAPCLGAVAAVYTCRWVRGETCCDAQPESLPGG